ncbi:MAG: methionine synthase [Bacteroidales bacterium]|nr:methionine synthase [Bacteroidales bacterium]
MTGLKELIRERVLVLDGAMGTMIQRAGAGGGNNDMLAITQPEVIAAIHRGYLEAGADIIETDTFNAQRISQADYNTADRVREMNLAAASIARREADRMTRLTPWKPRFVAGSVGPTGKTASLSPDVEDPAYRVVGFDELYDAYREQIEALVEGGVDMILVETVFDTLNAKAAVVAAHDVIGGADLDVPVMVSVTVADKAGRILSGQTVEAFLASVAGMGIFSVGLNCSFGAGEMLPFIEELSVNAPFYVSVHPNAGMPDELGGYSQTPEIMAENMRPYLERRLVNIAGGCCGTTPEHIAAISALVDSMYGTGVPQAGHLLSDMCVRVPGNGNVAWLSGIDAFYDRGVFINVGERCNVAGSRKFLRLIKEKSYEEAIDIAAAQVRDGAMVIDINMDDAMLDASAEMTHFLNLIASDPDISRVPIMVDSSRFEVIEAALKCIQGKAIVNSLSLKEGEDMFLERAARVKELGAALVVMAFDEQGQATSYERKIQVCGRAYRLLTERLGFNPRDIIFDPNILTVATGMKEHDRYALDFIDACAWIHKNLPYAKVSGGVSNLSFSFRGNNYLREAMHAVFLYHAISAQMDMAIINPSSAVTYEDIDIELREALEDVILCRKEDAVERLMDMAGKFRDASDARQVDEADRSVVPVGERLCMALQRGDDKFLQEDLEEALSSYPAPSAIIEGPLMQGMTAVGELFGAGKMFLPQVVKTARTMKRAVEILRPYIESSKSDDGSVSRGVYLMATVKGDVHDIGKNIAGVVLACNNFEVIDLGVMVPAETIVREAIENNVDFIGLSGLITPSLDEMCNVARKLREAGVCKPLFIGGATTSELHTAVKIAPLYGGPVFYVKDAAQNPVIATRLLGPESESLVNELYDSQERLRRSYSRDMEHATFSCTGRLEIEWKNERLCTPSFIGLRVLDEIPVSEVREYINWIYFYHLWGVKPGSAEAEEVRNEAESMLDSFSGKYGMRAELGFFRAFSRGDSIVLQHPAGCPCCSHAGDYAGNPGCTVIATPRQSAPNDDGIMLSLADFVAPEEYRDHVGVFAVTVPEAFVCDLEALKSSDDSYASIMMQGLGDRLAEAASEYLHMKIRRELWGYAPDENLTVKEMCSAKYSGIRPAVGYPSLPGQKTIFKLAELLDFSSVGISLTENGAMYPQSSVCGLYLASPHSRYFVV